MFERASVCVLAVIMLAPGSPLAAQSEDFAERERALARELAEQQEASAQQEQELARELAAQQRELVAQQTEQQRELAREFEAQQREVAAQQAEQQRALAREFEAQQRELASELSKAKSQLAVSAAEIARLSAELSGPAMRSVQSQLLFLRQGSVLGINIEDAELGVRVDGVSPNGPAAAAGVAVGDTIVAINGFELGRGAANRIDSPSAAFLGQLADVEPGADVELRILRAGNSRDVTITSVAAVPPFRFATVAPGSPRVTIAPNWPNGPNAPESIFLMSRGPWSDVELVSLTPGLGEYFGTDAGLLVVRAGRMGDLGLRDGDVILELGGREPQSPEHAMRILASFEPGESLETSIMRQRRRDTVTITVPTEPAGLRIGD
jgi:hypothetical protein